MNKTVPLVDFADGLRRFIGDQEIYGSTLSLYFERYQQLDEEVGKLIEEEEIEKAAFLLHGIKGAAATLSLTAHETTLDRFNRYLRNGEMTSKQTRDFIVLLGEVTAKTKVLVDEYLNSL